MKNYLCAFLLFFFFSAVAHAQEMKVSGVVTSAEDGQPVIGATVTVKGNTAIGTVTDIDGNFQLMIPAGTDKIVVSYVGMKSQELTPSTRSMNIQLTGDTEVLEEVVVTGMQRQDKRLFTGATTQVDADKALIGGMTDISRSLEGRSAGVSVQNVSGTFGTAPKIRVRGATSIYGASKPLWVVDGVIMEDAVEIDADALSSGDATTLISSAIAGLNSDDIESFQILKDGSATSIYGARAMAGVIVVTTKKGKAGTSRISYTGEFTTRMKPRYSDFNIMNSQDQMSVYQELKEKGFLNMAELSNASISGVYGKMYDLINNSSLLNTEAARNAYLREAEVRNTDWFDELFSNAMMHNHSVSISSGTDKSSFYASLSAMVDPGWTKSSNVNRYTANLNTSYNLSKQLTFNMLANASYRKQKAPGTLAQDTDPVSGEVKRDFDINPYSYAINTSRTLDPNEYYKRNYAPFNIFNELDNNYMDLNVVDMKFQAELRYKPVTKVELSALGAVRYQSNSIQHNIKDNSNQAMAYRAMDNSTIRDSNPFLYQDPDNLYALPITVLPNGGIYERTNYDMISTDFRATAAYNDVYNDIHILNLFGGMEINATDRSQDWFRGWGMQYDLGETPSYAYEVFKKGAEENTDYYTLSHTRYRNAAFFANGTYSYNGIYTISGTIRYEGSNKLGKTRSARWLPTWNISGAWNAHEEEFFDVFRPVLSHFTAKASYSLTADRGPADVSNAEMIIVPSNLWRPSASLTETALAIYSNANEDLTYEKKKEFNLGFEMGFIDNRINFTFDWYRRNNYDLIGYINTPGYGGEITKMGNVANMKSKGVEISLSTQNIKTKDFSWTTDFIYSHTHNVVTRLDNTSRAIDRVSGIGLPMEGYPVRGVFSYQFKGLNEEGLPTFIDETNGTLTVSDINFQSYDADYLVYSGNADPTDVGSFGNTFTYKGFRLNVFITYSFGNVVRMQDAFDYEYSDFDAMPKEFKNRWMVPGDEDITNIPVIASQRQIRDDTNLRYAYSAYNYSDARIAKGDFIRMKEISLGYDFPKAWASKLGLNALSLKAQGTNLFLIYADKKLNGQDPEFFNSGGVAVPVPRQFTFTLRFSL